MHLTHRLLSILLFSLVTTSSFTSDNTQLNLKDYFSEFQITADTVKLKLKDHGIRFKISQNKESRITQYGEMFTLKVSDKLAFGEKYLSLSFNFTQRVQLNEEQTWHFMCREKHQNPFRTGSN